MPMSREQVKQLKSELGLLSPYRVSFIAQAAKQHPRPASVRKAARVVSTYENKLRRATNQLDRRYRKLYNAFNHVLYFGTEREALALLQKMRAMALAAGKIEV